MKKKVVLLLYLVLFVFCGPKSEVPERVMEDGVEVVLNRLEPYRIKGEAASFTLEKEFSIAHKLYGRGQ